MVYATVALNKSAEALLVGLDRAVADYGCVPLPFATPVVLLRPAPALHATPEPARCIDSSLQLVCERASPHGRSAGFRCVFVPTWRWRGRALGSACWTSAAPAPT